MVLGFAQWKLAIYAIRPYISDFMRLNIQFSLYYFEIDRMWRSSPTFMVSLAGFPHANEVGDRLRRRERREEREEIFPGGAPDGD